MDEAERCNRVALIDKGRIILCDTPDGLKRRMHGELLEVIAEPLREANDIVTGLPGVLGAQVFGERLHLWVEDAAQGEKAVRAALTGRKIPIISVRRVEPGLEDVFISVISGGERHGDKR